MKPHLQTTILTLLEADIHHQGVCFPNEHEAIVTRDQWKAVQASLASSPNGAKRGQMRVERPALLKGLIFTRDGRAMTPHSTKGKGGKLYRYYLSTRDSKVGHGASHVKMLPAGEVDEAVMAQVRALLRSHEMVAQVWREIAKLKDKATAGMNETQVAVALNRIDLVWEQLFPLEQHRILQLLVERVIMKIMDAFGAGGSFTEYHAIDFQCDEVLMGHDGPGHVRIAQGKTKVRPLEVYHGKSGSSLSVEMSVRHGPVTLL